MMIYIYIAIGYSYCEILNELKRYKLHKLSYMESH